MFDVHPLSAVDFLKLNTSDAFWRWITEFPGDYTDGETPDPIPNSQAKPVGPMIVRKGESRCPPGIYKGRWRKLSALSFCAVDPQIAAEDAEGGGRENAQKAQKGVWRLIIPR